MPRRRALTNAEAAELAGMTRQVFNAEVRRAAQRGFELRTPRETWPDDRTRRYDRKAIEQYLAARPGKGRRSEPWTSETAAEQRRGQ